MAKKMSLEDKFEKLDATIEALEDKDISLENSFKLYEEGMKLIKECNAEIDKVEKQVLVLNERGETDEF